ncbi:MAG TPA: hypothetical protein VL486_10185 [Verrucomicrobiae bacterium]|nr:hypothetical protein [Verrucomicrobiae bacterium]
MKGLLISLAALLTFAAMATVAPRLVRLKRDLQLLVYVSPLGAVAYFILFAVTPPDLGFLPKTWMCSSARVDLFYGFAVYVLNCHTLIDCLSASCGGFSVSLLIIILRQRGQPASTDVLLAKFRLGDQADSIYGWRLPHLEKRGYIRKDPLTGYYSLTLKGRVVAVVAHRLKRLMNLGEGG